MKSKLFRILVLAAFSMFGLADAHGEILYRGYYKDPAVTDFQEQPSLATFAAIDSEHRVLLLAEILSTANSQDADSRLFKIANSQLPHLSASDRADVMYYAFQLSVQANRAELATEYFAKGVGENPKLAQKYICGALSEAGMPDRDSLFEVEYFKQSAEKVANLLPLIAQVPRLSELSCEMPMEDNGNPEDPFQPVRIAELIEKASPDFQTQLAKLVRERSLAAGRAKKSVALEITESFSACSKQQIRNYLNHNILPTLSNMLKGSSQYASYQDNGCVVNGIFKKIVSKQATSYEFIPRNERFSYAKVAIQFRTTEELVELLKDPSRLQFLMR